MMTGGSYNYNSYNITSCHFITQWISIILKKYILICKKRVVSLFQEQKKKKIEPEFGNNYMFSELSLFPPKQT